MHINSKLNFKFDDADCKSFLRYSYHIACSVHQDGFLDRDMFCSVSRAIRSGRIRNGVQRRGAGRLEAYMFYKYRDKKCMVMLYYTALGVTNRKISSSINPFDTQKEKEYYFDFYYSLLSKDKEIVLDDDFVDLCCYLKNVKIYEKIISEFEEFKLMYI